MGGWQEYSVVNAATPGALRKVDTTHVPLSATWAPWACRRDGLGTAWSIIAPKAGDTVVVSAATGAVERPGCCQLARPAAAAQWALPAARTSASTPVVDELGFDACIDLGTPRPEGAVGGAETPAQWHLDGYFENVGGWIMDAVMLRMNAFSASPCTA